MKTKEVKCISNHLFEDKLVVGNEYQVIDTYKDLYILCDPNYAANNTIYLATVPMNHFEDID